MGTKSISQLDTQATPHDTDLFEVAVVDGQSASGYASKKMSAEVIADGMLNRYTYPVAMPNMQNRTITGALNALLANFAPVYDATQTYSEGDVVTYNGALYKANTDISVSEAWDSSHWDAFVMSEIAGGNYHKYSTTEQVVGEWVDGKTLYEKTYVFTASDLSNSVLSGTEISGRFNVSDLDSAGYDMIWIEQAFSADLNGSGSSRSTPMNFPNSTEYHRVNIQKSTDDPTAPTYIYMKLTYGTYAMYNDIQRDPSSVKFIVVVRYTKTN